MDQESKTSLTNNPKLGFLPVEEKIYIILQTSL